MQPDTALCESGKLGMGLHFVLVSTDPTVSQRSLNERIKLDTTKVTVNLSAPFLVIFCVGEEDIWILM